MMADLAGRRASGWGTLVGCSCLTLVFKQWGLTQPSQYGDVAVAAAY